MKLTCILLALLSLLTVQGQSIKAYKSGPRVLTFAEQEYGRAQVKVKSGSYTLVAYTPDSVFSMEYGIDDVHPLYTFRGDLRLNRAACDSIVISTDDTIVMRVMHGKKWTRERPYMGQLTIRPFLIYLEAIVKVPISNYIAGVVEAEGGLSPEPAYHQAQAVLSRTWLLTNLSKHAKDGYHVKDDQSSQAFKGVPHGKNASIIQSAVLDTRDSIATYDNKPIIGFYHSNSGGMTTLPHLVWSKELPYCHAVIDPFSKKGGRYEWQQRISFSDWSAYWISQGVSMEAEEWSTYFNSINSTRSSHWQINEQSFKLETVRRHFKWKSGFVSPLLEGETVVVHGYGFGHGVGMSQQGAMYMGASGFTWKEILDFYFKDLSFTVVDNL